MGSEEGSGSGAAPAAAAEALKQRADVLYSAGKLAPALALYAQAVEADPANPVYRSNRSACLFELGRYAESAAAVEACLRLLAEQRAAATDAQAALRAKLLRRRALCTLYQLPAASTNEAVGQVEEALQASPSDAKLQQLHAWLKAGRVGGAEASSSAAASSVEPLARTRPCIGPPWRWRTTEFFFSFSFR